jgi:hypothetical protein
MESLDQFIKSALLAASTTVDGIHLYLMSPGKAPVGFVSDEHYRNLLERFYVTKPAFSLGTRVLKDGDYELSFHESSMLIKVVFNEACLFPQSEAARLEINVKPVEGKYTFFCLIGQEAKEHQKEFIQAGIKAAYEKVTIPAFINPTASLNVNDFEKVGEGATSDVFSCRQGHIIGVILFFGNVGLDNGDDWDVDEKLEQARRFPKIFPLVFDIFHSDIPYSTDEMYLQNSNDFESRTIQVIEKVDTTFDKYYMSLTTKEMKMSVKKELERVLNGFMNTLTLYEIYYADLKSDNIGVIIVDGVPKFKLIDIESIHLDFKTGFQSNQRVLQEFLDEDGIWDQ